jgi:UDP:flavonoid glycosyltransferase YjiC (YdhE family)
MRVLMTTTRGAGHFGPLIPFAHALLRAGHEVRVAVPAASAAMVQRAGVEPWLTPNAPATETAAVFKSLQGLSWEESNKRVAADLFGGVHVRAALPAVLEAVDLFRADLVVSETGEFAGPLAAEARGVPHVRVQISGTAAEAWFLPFAGASVDALRAELGLDPDPGVERLLHADSLTLTPQAFEDPVEPGTPEPYRFREIRAPRAPLPDYWGGDDRPLVYVTFGSVAAGNGYWPDLYRGAADALAEVDARVLITTGEGVDLRELGKLPRNVHVERWVPQAQVLSHAAAVVGHGGFGTTLGALAAGVPQVVLPLFADQPLHAKRVARIGAGVMLDGGPAAVAWLAGAVTRVLADPGYRAAAAYVAADVASLPPVGEAVDLLSQIARPGAATRLRSRGSALAAPAARRRRSAGADR